MHTVATIGMFDGVHQGHQFLLEHLLTYAHERGLRSIVVTFSQHPRSLLNHSMDGLLNSLEERKAKIEAIGVNKVVVLDFQSIHSLTAKEFLVFLRDEYDVTDLLMGYNHHFGSDCLSSFEQYAQTGKDIGIHIEQITAAPDKEVSSSLIRKAILNGYIDVANRLLSYEYTLTGKVVHGKGLGRQIGFPTANLSIGESGKVLPKAGVYHIRTEVNGVEYAGVMNIGCNPTVQDNEQKIFLEVHLIGFEGDLYGRTIRTEILHRLRDEQKFDTIDELKSQIKEDIERVRHLSAQSS